MERAVSNQRAPKTHKHSIHTLRQVVATLECCSDMLRVHALVLGEVLRVLPFKELDAVLGHWLAAKMAIGSALLILRLAERQRHSNRSRAAIEGDLEDVGNVVH